MSPAREKGQKSAKAECEGSPMEKDALTAGRAQFQSLSCAYTVPLVDWSWVRRDRRV